MWFYFCEMQRTGKSLRGQKEISGFLGKRQQRMGSDRLSGVGVEDGPGPGSVQLMLYRPVQRCEYLMVPFQMGKIVNYMLCVFYHRKKV